jgi:class 3 adenylate cyclase
VTEAHALLLTDLVDSTQLAERLGDARMAAVWAAHDRTARDLLPPHRGREIDKTDGFLLLFEGASDAVSYALAYHRALRDLSARLDVPLAARAGLHVGPVVLRENAPEDVARGAKPLEVEGVAKPVAARIMGLAVGGQTLLSDAARASLGEVSHRLESHGHWRMKGVAEPVELFEVGDDRAPFTPPPDAAKVYRVVRHGELWLPVKQVKHSLPTERDAFVGRDADLQDLARRLDDGAHLISDSASAAPARPASSPATAGPGSGTGPAAPGSAICPRPGAWTASSSPSLGRSTCRSARTTRSCSSATPSPAAVGASSSSTTSSRWRGTPPTPSGAGWTEPPRRGSW